MAPPPLHPELQAKLVEYRKERNFVPETWIDAKVAKLNEYMQRFGLKTCVTSISGGIDSAVILALCAAAKVKSGSPIVNNVGVCQPIHSSAWALERGRENIAAAGAIEVVVDQTNIHTQLQALVDGAVGIVGSNFAAGQLRSYMRTPVGYYVAQLYSQQGNPAIVMGTGNMDEDGYLAYFCKAGDGVVDVQLISDLHKSEVFQVARALGVPSATVVAPPSADLWDGQTDEDELGFTYDFVELFTGSYLKKSEDEQQAFRASLSQEAAAQFEAHAKAAEGVHRRNKHKLAGIQNL
jgi:NAD+ synthase (glutamine-hydrolysing)